MERHTLSKSTFIRGVQCLKSLYLYKKRYFLRDPLSQEQQAVFSRGTRVGVLARALFPGGKDATPASPSLLARSVSATAEWIARGEQVIYEATFQHEKILVMLDILVRTPQGWVGIEVKSSGSVSETYLLDAALQYYVITGSGLALADMRIMYINSEYTRDSGIELEKLFTSQSVLEQVLSRQDFIREQIGREQQVILLPHSPPVPVGVHCHDPYACDFIGHCWKSHPHPSVFDLDAFSEEEQHLHFSAGDISLEQLTGSAELTPLQQMQIDSHLSGEMFLDKNALQTFISLCDAPFAYVKILFCRPALPLFTGTRPYEPLPFAFAVLAGQQGSEPYIYIAPPGADPRNAFTEHWRAGVSGFKTLLVSTPASETVSYPHQIPVNANVINMLTPFKENMIYHPGLACGQRLAEITGYSSSGDIQGNRNIQSDTMAGVRYLALADALEGEAYDLELAQIKRYVSQCLAELEALHLWLKNRISSPQAP